MGLDAQIWARGDVTPEQVAAAERLFENRLPGFLWDGKLSHGDRLVEAPTGCRYYGVGYERGPWPTIYAAILLMRECFPGAVVSYGSDDWIPEDGGDYEATDERLADLWAHWVGPDGDAYHEGR